MVAQLVKNLPAMREIWVQSLGLENPLHEGTAAHSSILAWRMNSILFMGYVLCVLSHVQFFVTPWTTAHQAPLSMEFSRQELEWVAIPFSRGSSQLRD